MKEGTQVLQQAADLTPSNPPISCLSNNLQLLLKRMHLLIKQTLLTSLLHLNRYEAISYLDSKATHLSQKKKNLKTQLNKNF